MPVARTTRESPVGEVQNHRSGQRGLVRCHTNAVWIDHSENTMTHGSWQRARIRMRGPTPHGSQAGPLSPPFYFDLAHEAFEIGLERVGNAVYVQ